MRFSRVKHTITHALLLLGLLSLALNGCALDLSNPTGSTSTAEGPSGPTATPQAAAAVTFSVTLPSPLPEGETLYLAVLDEIAGLALNPVNHAMQGMDSLHYTVTLPIRLNSVVKYRYLRQGALPIPEEDSLGRQVRYRLIQVTGPFTTADVIASWADGAFGGPSGRIIGRILDSATSAPLNNILVAAGGQQTLSDASGSFVLEGLPAGTHNLVAYAIDGSYQTFQQGARVESGRSTPVELRLIASTMVEVTFTLSVPSGTVENSPIRLAGNLYQLGNTFGDLRGGVSSVASRMPVLTPAPDGRYTLTLRLPSGADIRYRYTLGDGFWNAEHNTDGSFVTRQLIVPAGEQPLQIQEAVVTWQSGPSAPITFELDIPETTPASDAISIQFNPYSWTEPIPMWPLGNHRWAYILYSPLDMLGSFEYRYCRNDQCGLADDSQTGPGQLGRPVATSLTPQDLQDQVSAWNWFTPIQPASLVGYPVGVRQPGFWAGVEFLPDYDPTWQAWTPAAIQNVQSLYANWLVLTPTWTLSQTSPLLFSPLPGTDPLWADSTDTIHRARAANLSVALFPQPGLPTDALTWWAGAPQNPSWWDAWFSRYQAFALHHAHLAESTGAQALILGGEWVVPALPGAALVPVDAEARWRSLLGEVRQAFGGSLLWAVAYPGGLEALPGFARDLDGIYLLWYAALEGNSVEELELSAGQRLDADIQPLQADLQKPVILAVALPALDGAVAAQHPLADVLQPAGISAGVNLQVQVDLYQALLLAVNERAWLGGLVSRGYFPPVILQDTSASVHGKPAADVLWYWFGRFLGLVQ